MNEVFNPIGSIWHRWEPHIHIPGTLLNDNYSGSGRIEQFIKAVDDSNPAIKALGITDYFKLSYETIMPYFAKGLLIDVEVIFPNIEMRFAVNAAKGSPINVHLLVNPKDPEHVAKTKRFLNDVKFEYKSESYGCSDDELKRLGKSFQPDENDEEKLLQIGAGQFKPSPDALRKAFKDHIWAKDNIMMAIASSTGDGTGQLQESGLKALREELQRMSHFIFSARPGDRDYWLGLGADPLEFLKNNYGGAKACLHGSDAHDFQSVGNPDGIRYCWIKGDLSFETLSQTSFEPDKRVHIGPECPNEGFPSNIISKIEVVNAPWLESPNVELNSGMVAVIGARGSGKTALVEMVAACTDSVDKVHKTWSFL